MKYLLIPALVIGLVACNKEEVDPTPGTACIEEASGNPKSCPQVTVNYTALANQSYITGNPGFGAGQLKDVWEGCYGGPSLNLLPSCATGTVQQQTLLYFNCIELDQLLGSGWTNYPNVSYAQQQTIINYVVAQANLARPNCSYGGKMNLWTIGFLRDTNIPLGFCFTARYYCCPR